MRTTTFVLPAITLTALTVTACGGGGGDGNNSDPVDARASDGGGATTDAGGASVDAAPAPCTAPDSFGEAGALQAQGFFVADVNEGTDDGATDDLLVMFAPLDMTAAPDAIELRLYAGYGAFAGGAIRTGTFQLSGAELDLNECGVCAGVVTDTTAEAYADDYLPTGGTVELTAIATAAGQMLTGRLTNVTFQRMTIAEDGSTTPTDPNCTTAVTSATFSVMLMTPPDDGGGQGP